MSQTAGLLLLLLLMCKSQETWCRQQRNTRLKAKKFYAMTTMATKNSYCWTRTFDGIGWEKRKITSLQRIFMSTVGWPWLWLRLSRQWRVVHLQCFFSRKRNMTANRINIHEAVNINYNMYWNVTINNSLNHQDTSETMTLVVNNSVAIWRHFCLHGPIRQRHLWERLFKRRFINGLTYLLTYRSHLQNDNRMQWC